MVSAQRWGPRRDREERSERAIRSMADGSQRGMAASAQPIPSRRPSDATDDTATAGQFYEVNTGIAPAILDEGLTHLWFDLSDSLNS